MKGIVHIRIDDRLIHGQVAAFWTNSLSISRIMVVNDEVAVDEMQKSLLRMVAPASVRTSIISKETAIKNNPLAVEYIEELSEENAILAVRLLWNSIKASRIRHYFI